ncbi:MAG: VCBS repeat-containing protein [Clostridium sp.]|nr:VCBS repeat-containing protein [Clostridium sp.]
MTAFLKYIRSDNRMKNAKENGWMMFLGFMISCLAFWPLFSLTLQAAEQTGQEENVLAIYQEYQARLEAIENRSGIEANGFDIVENQIFPIEITGYGEVSLIPAFEREYHRLALFFVTEGGSVIYKTDQLAANSRVLGQMKQPDCDIAAVSFRDLDEDGHMDIILITSCMGVEGVYEGKTYKVGDVLFQNGKAGFYRDYRISDKINRFGMNKSAEVITAFVRDGYSTEFLYTATTLKELLAHGLDIINEQCYFRTFGKLGRLQVVPGTYRIANFDVFMIYLVNEQGDIISSLQPMGDYDNLYALKGINCRDIDGDGLKDIVVLARYSYEGEAGELVVESDYAIYYQRTGGFSADMDIKETYRCSDEDTMELLIEKARAYWGWVG